MYVSHARLVRKHRYSSRWYTWPLMSRPIFYWRAEISVARVQMCPTCIYLLGNPFVWWVSTGLTAMAALRLLRRIFSQAGRRLFQLRQLQTVAGKANYIDSAGVLLVAGYLTNLVPFVAIGRVMFLYHYFPSLIFSSLSPAPCWHASTIGEEWLSLPYLC